MFDRKKNVGLCDECGLDLPFNMPKKTKDLTPGGQLLCKTCARVCITCLFLLTIYISA